MADDDDPKTTSAYKKQNTENESANSNDVGQALQTLASQLGAFLDEIKTDRDTVKSERSTDRNRQWFATWIGLALSFFTLLVLILTYLVYRSIGRTEATQATIMGQQTTIMATQKQLMSIQASIAGDAADASKMAAEAAVQTLLVEETPHVYLDNVKIKPLRIGERTEVDVTYINRSDLDAPDFEIGGTISFVSKRPEQIVISTTNEGTVLTPRKRWTSTLSSPDVLTSGQLNAVKKKTVNLYVTGYLYWGSPIATVHSTRGFCSVYDTIHNSLTGCPAPVVTGPNGETFERPLGGIAPYLQGPHSYH